MIREGRNILSVVASWEMRQHHKWMGNWGQRKEMTFTSVDIFFGRVSAMDVGRRKLVGKCNGLHVAFEAVGAFIVHDL